MTDWIAWKGQMYRSRTELAHTLDIPFWVVSASIETGYPLRGSAIMPCTAPEPKIEARRARLIINFIKGQLALLEKVDEMSHAGEIHRQDLDREIMRDLKGLSEYARRSGLNFFYPRGHQQLWRLKRLIGRVRCGFESEDGFEIMESHLKDEIMDLSLKVQEVEA